MGQLKYRLCITNNCFILPLQGNHLLQNRLHEKGIQRKIGNNILCFFFFVSVLNSSLFLNTQNERRTDSWPTQTGTRTRTNKSLQLPTFVTAGEKTLCYRKKLTLLQGQVHRSIYDWIDVQEKTVLLGSSLRVPTSFTAWQYVGLIDRSAI